MRLCTNLCIAQAQHLQAQAFSLGRPRLAGNCVTQLNATGLGTQGGGGGGQLPFQSSTVMPCWGAVCRGLPSSYSVTLQQ